LCENNFVFATRTKTQNMERKSVEICHAKPVFHTIRFVKSKKVNLIIKNNGFHALPCFVPKIDFHSLHINVVEPDRLQLFHQGQRGGNEICCIYSKVAR
jgi:hypothetical protein